MSDSVLRLDTPAIEEATEEDPGADHPCNVFGGTLGAFGGLETRAVDVGVGQGYVVVQIGGGEKVFGGMGS